MILYEDQSIKLIKVSSFTEKQKCLMSKLGFIGPLSVEPVHEISNNLVCATSKASDQPAHTRSLIRAFARRLNILSVKLLTEHHLEYISLTGGCTGSSESTHLKMPHCWKSHVTAQLLFDKNK